MRRKIVAIFCMTLALSATAVGCKKNEKNTADKQSESISATEADAVDYDVNDYLKLGDYKGLEVEYITPEEPTKEDIDQSIQDEIEQQAEDIDIKDKGAEKGNWVNIDYTGKVDGKEFDGGSAEEYDLQLGSNDFIEGFEEQLVGVKAGDKKEVNVTFPNPYENDPSLAGKAAVFEVKVNRVYNHKVPEYNDEFVASVSKKSKTKAEYEQEIKEKLDNENKKAAEESAQEMAVQGAVENAEMNGYPEELYQACYDGTVSNYKSNAEMFGVDYKTFLSDYMNMTDKDIKEEAKNWVKEILTMQAIAQKEGLEPDDTEYKEGLKEMAEENGYDSAEEMEKDYGEFSVRIELRKKKVGAFLYKNAKIDKMTQEEYDKKYGGSDGMEASDGSDEEEKPVG